MCYDCGRINGHISTLADSQPGLSSSAFAQSLAKTQMFVLFSVCLASGSDSLLRDSSLSLFPVPLPDLPFRLLLLLVCLVCLSLSFSCSVFHSCVSLSVPMSVCLSVPLSVSLSAPLFFPFCVCLCAVYCFACLCDAFMCANVSAIASVCMYVCESVRASVLSVGEIKQKQKQ